MLKSKKILICLLLILIALLSLTSCSQKIDKDKLGMVHADIAAILNPESFFANLTQLKGSNAIFCYDFLSSEKVYFRLLGDVNLKKNNSAKIYPQEDYYDSKSAKMLVKSTLGKELSGESEINISELTGEQIMAYISFKDNITLTQWVEKYYKKYRLIDENKNILWNGVALNLMGTDNTPLFFINFEQKDYFTQEGQKNFIRNNYDKNTDSKIIAQKELANLKEIIMYLRSNQNYTDLILNTGLYGDIQQYFETVNYNFIIDLLNYKTADTLYPAGFIVTADKESIAKLFENDSNLKLKKAINFK